jgi:hypothetical protein
VSVVTPGTVLVLPNEDPHLEQLLTDFLRTHLDAELVDPVAGPTGAIVARICAAINASHPAPPLVIVAAGATARILPNVALSQRAMHRRVAEYLLIEPSVVTVTDAWPDAPVSVMSERVDDTTLAALRGWTVMSPADIAAWRPSH